MGYAVGVDFGSVLSTAGIIKWDNDCPQERKSCGSPTRTLRCIC